MKLKSIKLNNIGLYKNELIEFPYDGNENTIIVWGNNGAGKTTLINSVKIGLLGKNAVQMTYPEYCDFVKSKLISTRCDIKNEVASIEIEIELNDNYKKNIYKILRTWTEENDIFTENDYIFQNDMELSVDDKDYIQNTINHYLPASLLDVIIFDGENAINILNEGKMSKLIKEILYSVFGMDIYSFLSRDLSTFLRSTQSNSDISAEEQMNFIKLETDYKSALKNSKNFEKLVEEEKKKKTNKTREIKFLLKRFSEKNGINVEEIEILNKSLAHADSNKEQMNSDLKYIYEEILPLKLIHKRIRNMITQLDENQSYKAMKNISDLKKYFLNCEKAQTWLENLNSMLPKDLPVYAYDFSETDIDTIRRVNEILNGYSKDKILKAIENKNDYLKEVKEKLIISNKMESKESQEMLSKLEKMYSEFEEIDLNLVKLKEEEEKSRDYLNEKKESYQLYKSNITKQKKESSSYVVALKYRDVIDEFIDINIKDVCLKLNTTLLKYLQEMKFRNNSIGSVDISSKTFDINLYEKNGEMIPSYLFSAGEKQVLLGLVIKAALNLSNNDCFFLFDTPVGRLDKKNREIFTKEVIFTVSDQSFIFATDSDYSEDDYLRIKSRIRAEYKLDRNKNDEIIAVNGSIY